MADVKRDALDDRLDALIDEVNDNDAPEVKVETQLAILTNMQQVYANTLMQSKFEMRLALKSGDKQMQDAVRANLKLTLVKMDEIGVMLKELNVDASPRPA